MQIAVADLEAAARHFSREHGLVAVAGGRHPGRGTGNLIVPLGDSYLELIAVLDAAEADVFTTSRRVARAVEFGRTFAVWAARTPDLEATRQSLAQRGLALPDAVTGSRSRADGVQLTWRMQELVSEAEFSPLPFLIEWKLPPGLFPGATSVKHPSGARGVASVRLAAPDLATAQQQLQVVLEDDVNYSVEEGPPGVVEIVLDTPHGPLPLR